MGLMPLIIVLIALFVFTIAINTDLSALRKTYLHIFWIPCIMTIADVAGFNFPDGWKLFVIVLSILLGVVGLILLVRLKRNQLPMIALIILTDFAFLPSVYYAHVFYSAYY